MTTPPIESVLLDDTDPASSRPLPAALRVARADVIAAARDLLAIPEAALTKPWAWIGGSEEEVRYGAYRAAEAMEAAEVQARVMTAARDAGEREVARIIAPTTAARWDLHGLLLPLDEGMLDADPGNGEWPIRLVMGHVIASQRGYAWANAWLQAHAAEAPTDGGPLRVPEAFWDAMPDEATTEAEGDLATLRDRLDAVTDLGTERLAGLPDDRLALPTRWAGFPVPLGFRFARWSSHLREHTILVEKTLAMLGHVPDEPARLVRNLLAAYGRAEAAVFARKDVDDAADRIALGAAEARQAAHDARGAAQA